MMNIAGSKAIDDPEYRYKMPRLVGKIEGRGNGIKTVITNCVDIASALHRSPAEVCKFFGCELAAQSKYDPMTERAVVNGAFDSGLMQNHLNKYIELFVLCPSCRLPETKYKYKNQMIYHKCLACGSVELVDMKHKLTTFILKQKAAEKRSKTKDSGEDKKKKRREKKESHEDASGDEEKKKKDKKKDKKEKKSKKKESQSDLPNPEEVEWHTDLSKEAVEARMQEAYAIEAAARNALMGANEKENEGESVVATLDNMSIDDTAAIMSAASLVQEFISKNADSSSIVEEVIRHQVNSALPACIRAIILSEAAFTDEILSGNQVAQFTEALKQLVANDREHQLMLIAFFGKFCTVKFPAFLPSYPIILKALYDEDVLEEETLLEWTSCEEKYAMSEVSNGQRKELKISLQPFIDWLQNAEEESDEDEDEE